MSDDQLQHQRAEFADLQAEIAGIPNGKQARFLDGEGSPRSRRGGQSKEDTTSQILQNELQRLLQDADYARAWNEANEALDALQTNLTTLTDQLAGRIEHLEDVVNDFEERTAQTADGSLVFRDADGRLVDAEGRLLSPDVAARVENPEDAQSYDQYRGAQEALRKARVKQDRIADIQRDVTRWKDRINDPDNPPDKDELEEIIKDAANVSSEIETKSGLSGDFGQAASDRVQEMISEPLPSIKAAP